MARGALGGRDGGKRRGKGGKKHRAWGVACVAVPCGISPAKSRRAAPTRSEACGRALRQQGASKRVRGSRVRMHAAHAFSGGWEAAFRGLGGRARSREAGRRKCAGGGSSREDVNHHTQPRPPRPEPHSSPIGPRPLCRRTCPRRRRSSRWTTDAPAAPFEATWCACHPPQPFSTLRQQPHPRGPHARGVLGGGLCHRGAARRERGPTLHVAGGGRAHFVRPSTRSGSSPLPPPTHMSGQVSALTPLAPLPPHTRCAP
jgi:hypothetical protein